MTPQQMCATMAVTVALGLRFSPSPIAGHVDGARSAQVAPPGTEATVLPLAPERTIEFNTDEGTWISLDVSPDGRTIVFDLLGDLYVMPSEGGAAKQITAGMAYDAQPRFAPNGKTVAFISDRDGIDNVWVCDPEGRSLRQITREAGRDSFLSPSWIDSEHLVVSKSVGTNEWELWTYSWKTGGGSRLSLPKQGAATRGGLGPVVDRQQGLIYHSVDVRRPEGPDPTSRYFPYWQVMRMTRQTGEEEIITNALGSAMRPVISPDGKLLVYATRRDTATALRVMDLDRGTDRLLKYPVQRDDQEGYASLDLMPGYAFTPDGRAVIAAYDGKIHRIEVDTGRESAIPFTATVRQDLGPKLQFDSTIESGPVRPRMINRPRVSPDGSAIAFGAFARLYVMQLPDGTPRQITPEGMRAFLPEWSSDGKWLAFVTWADDGGHVFKMRTDIVEPPVQVTPAPAFYRSLTWRPGGNSIVVLRTPVYLRRSLLTELTPPPTWELAVAPAAGGDAVRIASGADVGGAHFGPDSERVFFNSREGVVSIRLDGTDRHVQVRLVSGTGGGAVPTVISPDGRRALAATQRGLYVVVLPEGAGSPAPINIDAPGMVKWVVSVDRIETPGWAQEGRAITWSVGPTVFRVPTEAAAPLEPAAVRPDDLSIERFEIAVTRPRPVPNGRLMFRGATVITMHGAEVLRSADLLIEGNRIKTVAPSGQIEVPADVHQIDVRGTTIMPGLIDVHAHFTEIPRAIPDVKAWPLVANLAYGVTTARDPQPWTNDVFAYADLVDAGDSIGPRVLSTGLMFRWSSPELESADSTADAVARLRSRYRTNSLKAYSVVNRRHRQWLIQASKLHHMMPTIEGEGDLRKAVTATLDGFSGYEHNISIVPLFGDVVQLMARSGIAYTPTLLTTGGGPRAEEYFFTTERVHDDEKLRRFVPHDILDAKGLRRRWYHSQEWIHPKAAESANRISQAGGRICLGGHGQLQGVQCHWEMWALASGGMPNHDVLRAATFNGAQALGYGRELGSLEPGKLADLLVLNENPLDDIRNTATLRYVVKDGIVFDASSLDQIWPERRKFNQPRWWTQTSR